MSVTKLAFLPPNSAGATVHIFSLWLYAKYIPCLVLTLATPFPTQLYIRKKADEPLNYQTQLLGCWCQCVAVFETTQEEEIKILSPLLLITNSWLRAPASYKPRTLLTEAASYKPQTLLTEGHGSWSVCLLCTALHQLRIKATFLFPPDSVSVLFNSASVGREGQDFGHPQEERKIKGTEMGGGDQFCFSNEMLTRMEPLFKSTTMQLF